MPKQKLSGKNRIAFKYYLLPILFMFLVGCISILLYIDEDMQAFGTNVLVKDLIIVALLLIHWLVACWLKLGRKKSSLAWYRTLNSSACILCSMIFVPADRSYLSIFLMFIFTFFLSGIGYVFSEELQKELESEQYAKL